LINLKHALDKYIFNMWFIKNHKFLQEIIWQKVVEKTTLSSKNKVKDDKFH